MTAPSASSSPSVRFGQPSGGPSSAPGFGRAGALAGVALAMALLGGLLWSAAAGHTVSAQHPRLFGGSLVLEDQRPLTVIDLATGQVTVRLDGIYAQVGATSYGDVQAVAVAGGTMLIDRRSGTFNLLGKDNYVLDAAGAGVGLGRLAGSTGASGVAAGSDAYIVRYAPRSTVSLVDQTTVTAGARLERAPRGSGRAVTPRGFAALGGPVSDQPGSSVTSGGSLWTLVGAGSSCRVQQLTPVASGPDGMGSIARATLPGACRQAAAEAAPGEVGVATPGHVRLFLTGRPRSGQDVPVPGTVSATELLPVTGATATLWYLARGAAGWSIFGVTSTGQVTGPSPLGRLGPSAVPVTPVESGGILYTMDQTAVGQPTLWTVLPATGAMIPVEGAATYPARSRSEKAFFRGAQVLADGPRVVFNNPGSLLAVVVFTDGSHPPAIVDKSAAVEVSATGPAALGTTATRRPGRAPSRSSPTLPRPVPVAQAVNQKVTCANTTQKPYAPQISSVVPSSGSVLVAWSYQLLDQQDCEPDSWSLKVTALSGSHQPAQPVQVVNGQTQLQFIGLRPATTYQVAVTAYINRQATSSTPATFTTAARGPDPPTAVHTTADNRGDWVVSWTPCTAADCFVPADTWNVTGAACGSAFVGQPPTTQAPAGHNSVTIAAESLNLLGDSLSFSVQGVLASGLSGNPAADHACTQAWRPPDPADIALGAQGVEDAATGTITATLQVSTKGASAVEALGSHSTEFVYSVGGITVGPTTSPTVKVPGLAGGSDYTASVQIFPTGHPAAAVVVTGNPFSRNLSWPPGLGVAVAPSVGTDPNTGTLVLSFPGLPPGPMRAEDGTITCGSTQYPTVINQPLTGGRITVPRFDLVDFGGTCSLSIALTDAASPDPYGGVASPTLLTSFGIGTQPGYGFTAQISPDCQQRFCSPQQIEIDDAGSQPAMLGSGGDWTITSTGGPAHGSLPDPCEASFGETAPPTFPIVVTLPLRCLRATAVEIQVSYKYLGQIERVDAGTPSGTPATTTTTTSTTPSTTTPPTTTPPTTTPPTTTPPTTTPPTTTPPTTAPPTSAPPTTTPSTTAAAAAPTQLAVVQASQVPPLALQVQGDPQVGAALLAILVAAGAAGGAGVVRCCRRRRSQPRREPT